MKILDIDLDYFLYDIAHYISINNRLDDISYKPWDKEKVINFLENNLGLSKQKKIQGKIIINHNEALDHWKSLMDNHKLIIPFEVIHVDSHSDLGPDGGAWRFIFNKLLGLSVDKRTSYKEYFDEPIVPECGNYLLFAIAYRWIFKLTYIFNPKESGNDYIPYIMENGSDSSECIKLPYNDLYDPRDLNDVYKKKQYYTTSKYEPEVPFFRESNIDLIKYSGDFDYITFCTSPNFTPKSADFIIDIISDYIC